MFERHPHLKVAFTEQGSAWVVNELATLDSTLLVMDEDKSAQHFFGGDEMVHRLRKLPSEYFARNCSWMETAERGGWCSTSYTYASDIHRSSFTRGSDPNTCELYGGQIRETVVCLVRSLPERFWTTSTASWCRLWLDLPALFH